MRQPWHWIMLGSIRANAGEEGMMTKTGSV